MKKHSSYHFYQRVIKHRDQLEHQEKKVEKAVRKALRGVAKQISVHIHPTHFHVFAQIDEEKKLFLASRIKNEITGLEGISWDAEYYLTPVSSVDKKYVNKLLEEMHRTQLI